ncbi:MAG: hypothetical protein U0031_18675 [Thermomicrobiales bacterium]
MLGGLSPAHDVALVVDLGNALRTSAAPLSGLLDLAEDQRHGSGEIS